MKTVSTLIQEIGMTIIDSRELEHGITQYTLNNGCIVMPYPRRTHLSSR